MKHGRCGETLTRNGPTFPAATGGPPRSQAIVISCVGARFPPSPRDHHRFTLRHERHENHAEYMTGREHARAYYIRRFRCAREAHFRSILYEREDTELRSSFVRSFVRRNCTRETARGRKFRRSKRFIVHTYVVVLSTRLTAIDAREIYAYSNEISPRFKDESGHSSRVLHPVFYVTHAICCIFVHPIVFMLNNRSDMCSRENNCCGDGLDDYCPFYPHFFQIIRISAFIVTHRFSH